MIQFKSFLRMRTQSKQGFLGNVMHCVIKFGKDARQKKTERSRK